MRKGNYKAKKKFKIIKVMPKKCSKTKKLIKKNQ